MPRIAQAAGVILAIKVYGLIILLIGFSKGSFRDDYGEFVYVEEGLSRKERLSEIRADFLERLAPYDGQFYLDIANHGYRQFRKTENKRPPHANYAFFPLLPCVIGLASLFPWNVEISILILNVLLSTAASVALWCVATRLGIPAWPSVLLLLTFPTAIFQSVLYTESLFLFLSAMAFTCLLKSRPLGAGLFSALGGMCRPQGVLLSLFFLPRLVRALWSRENRSRAVVAPLALCAAPALGLAAVMAILGFTVGKPLGFLEIQSDWDRTGDVVGGLRGFWKYQGPPFDRVGLVFGVVLLPWMWKRLPPALSLYGTGSVVLPLLTGNILSFGRFISVSFPHFFCLALLLAGHRKLLYLVLATFCSLQVLLASALIEWRFVG